MRIVFVLYFLLITNAFAKLDCFLFPVKESPAKDIHSSLASAQTPEKWCYLELESHQKLVIFNAEHSSLQAELIAFLPLSQKKKNIQFFSNTKGILRVQNIDHGSLNPLPVPLDKQRAQEIAVPTQISQDFSFAKLDELMNIASNSVRTFNHYDYLEEGEYESYLPNSLLPFRGYWWSYSYGGLFEGTNAPLAKYDRIASSITGEEVKSAEWEANNHSSGAISWGGHCNGWAASSILYPEPNTFLWHEESSTELSPTDVKGILAASSFCVHYRFYGTRYRNENHDIEDIKPDLFHKVLIYYIKNLQKAVAFDYMTGESVDNHTISGYHFSIEKTSDNSYQVDATLRAHSYDSDYYNTPGHAEIYYTNYSYTLTVDDDNKITGGEWISENPDFLWVPLRQRTCGRENKVISPNLVVQLLRELPQSGTQNQLHYYESIRSGKEFLPVRKNKYPNNNLFERR